MTITGLTSEQLSFWEENGYLIIPDAISQEVVKELVDETAKLLNEFPLEGHPMTKFTTGDGDKHIGDDYFLNSNDKVRFFFEKGAFSSTGELIKPKAKAINKIGHALHTNSPPFANMTMTPLNRLIAKSLGFRDPNVMQSMIICKQPEIGGAVLSHQDSTFLYTDPPSAVGFWYALEDTTPENGCLSFVPGSHKWAPIKKRLVRLPEGGTGFEDLKEGQANGVQEKGGVEREGEGDGFVLGPVKKGSLVLIHGNVLHQSEKNLSPNSRWIYTFHVIEGEYPYDERNWLQPPEGGFSRLNDVELADRKSVV